MKIFSKLARKIMHADFRDRLMTASTAEQVKRF